MNPIERALARVRELSEKATPPAKWEKRAWAGVCTAENPMVQIADCFQSPNDAEFIAYSREMMPRLAEALRVCIETLKALPCACESENGYDRICNAFSEMERIFAEQQDRGMDE